MTAKLLVAATAGFLLLCMWTTPALADVTTANRTNCADGDPVPPNRVDTMQRVNNLLGLLNTSNLGAYIVPSGDAHQSEYVALSDRRLLYLSGFSGSNGIAVVLADGRRALWSDGRYFTQAENELDCNWIFMKEDMAGYPRPEEWLLQQLPSGSIVGADPFIIGAQTWLQMKAELAERGLALSTVGGNFVDQVWEEDELNPRPPYSDTPLFVHDIKYAGETWQSKLALVRTTMASASVDLVVVTALDEVAWLFNLRGRDIVNNPVFFSYAIVAKDSVTLLVAPEKMTPEVKAHLTNATEKVKVLDYSLVLQELQNQSSSAAVRKVLVPGLYTYALGSSYAIYMVIPPEKRLIARSPLVDPKSRKNPTEQACMREAHVKDAVAVIDFLAFMEQQIKAGETWDEITADERLLKSRAEQALFVERSFGSASAYGPNAAIIHYKPVPETNSVIGTNSTYLLDSGGQYLDGTTDITRTMYYGDAPRPDIVERYTRVLMGQIDLAALVFPAGTRDTRSDIVARRPLNAIGEDYRHGTGHGIGMFLNIHEAPIQVRIYATEEHPYELGHFFSDEPGFYLEGDYGIRLENVVTVVPTPYTFDVPFYQLDTVTLVPYEPILINASLLTEEQCTWLVNYNTGVVDTVGPRLLHQGKQAAYDWLLTKTQPIC